MKGGPGWYFYGVGDASGGSVPPDVYARFIRACVGVQPPPPDSKDEEVIRCQEMGGTWDPVTRECRLRKEETDYLFYACIAGAGILAGAGVYLLAKAWR
ncbi:MAG: hypothetical protein H5U03_06820 [Clostridia bacterium]|nr:hypothetical protein [Clostridia bacterium]